MLLRTDDDIYRARLVYLGPPNYTLPIQLPYAQYGLFAVLCTGFVGAGTLLTGGFGWIGVEIGAAMVSTYAIWRHVDPDRPARKILATAARDWRQTGPPPPAQLPSLSAARIRIGGPR
ncbi:hypothetical protein [Dactylosporangium sp. CA-139066]|uniref:hypothetical protein n=1 Tax=Dactylosporangium sp. CA-139066 TaxID=3239930 RepID=UPI003D8DF623